MSRAIESLVSVTQHLYSEHDSTPIIQVDTVLDPESITLAIVREIENMRPFGV